MVSINLIINTLVTKTLEIIHDFSLTMHSFLVVTRDRGNITILVAQTSVHDCMSPSIVLLYSILWYLIYTSKKHKEIYLFLNISTIYFHIKLPFFKNNCFFFTALLFLFLMAMMLQPLQTNFHKFCLVVC